MKFVLCIVGAFVLAVAPLFIVSAQAVTPFSVCKNEISRFSQTMKEGGSYTPTETSTLQKTLSLCVKSFRLWDKVASIYLQLPYIETLVNHYAPTYVSVLRDARTFSPLIDQMIRVYPTLVGMEGEKRYILLLQNNTELRPTGGFIGSFIYLVFKDGKLTEFHPEDIYVPDGQLKGYVKPPLPVETYLYQKGGWKLRDSNWDPDFPQAVQTMLWFFDKGGYQKIDGVVAITLSSVQEYINVLGPLYLPDYDKEVDAESLYAFAQSQTEQGFFPGASNKRDVLGSLTRALTRSISSLTLTQQQEIAHLLLKHLASKDVMVWSKDADVQEILELHQWDGAIRFPVCRTQQCRVDYLYPVEANVGINKANCCVDRKVTYEVWLNDDTTATSSAFFEYTNNNPVTPQPPKYYGGGYNNFLRIIRDPLWKLNRVQRDGKDVDINVLLGETDTQSQATSSGMLADVGGGESHTFTYEYVHEKRFDYTKPQEYVLKLQKQPGLNTNEYELAFHVPLNTKLKTVDSPVHYEITKNTLRVHTLVDRDLQISFTVSSQ